MKKGYTIQIISSDQQLKLFHFSALIGKPLIISLIIIAMLITGLFITVLLALTSQESEQPNVAPQSRKSISRFTWSLRSGPAFYRVFFSANQR